MRSDLTKREIIAEHEVSFVAEGLGDNHEKPGLRVASGAVGQHHTVAGRRRGCVEESLDRIFADLLNGAIHLRFSIGDRSIL